MLSQGTWALAGTTGSISGTLTAEGGKPVAAGTYSLTIKDESTLHNFHLSGDGVDKTTSIGSTSTSTFSVTFRPGTYTFVCDPHSSQMHGSFPNGSASRIGLGDKPKRRR